MKESLKNSNQVEPFQWGSVEYGEFDPHRSSALVLVALKMKFPIQSSPDDWPPSAPLGSTLVLECSSCEPWSHSVGRMWRSSIFFRSCSAACCERIQRSRRVRYSVSALEDSMRGVRLGWMTLTGCRCSWTGLVLLITLIGCWCSFHSGWHERLNPACFLLDRGMKRPEWRCLTSP